MRLLLALGLMVALQPGCIVVVVDKCVDGIRNGTETDVDCGGATCGLCVTGERCAVAADCVTGACNGGVCGPPLGAGCSNGLKDGTESDIDCGGACAACALGKRCAIANDCQSNQCTSTVCSCALPLQAASTANYPQFTVLSGGVASIASGDVGLVVTINGAGGYRVAWSDQANAGACFQGIIRANGGFDNAQTMKVSGSEMATATAMEIRFSSVPGSRVDGIDMVTVNDPMYLDAYVNGSLSNVHVYYVNSSSQQVATTANPAAFTP